jgi:hypothetical protein
LRSFGAGTVQKVRKKQKMETKPRAVMPSNLHSIVIMDKHITKCLYGQDYEYNTSLRVIGAALQMQKAHLQRVAMLEKAKANLVEKPQIRDMICNLFHIGHDAYSKIVGVYLHKRDVYVTGRNSVGRGGNQANQENHTPDQGDASCSARFCSEPENELPESYCKASAGLLCGEEVCYCPPGQEGEV